METVKARSNTFLTIAVVVNILFCFVSIGCLIYKVRVLEEQVFSLQSESSKVHQPESRDNEDGIYRSKRSVGPLGRSKSCSSCHDACVQLFGLGASAKVRANCNISSLFGNICNCLHKLIASTEVALIAATPQKVIPLKKYCFKATDFKWQ